jgi:cytochrome b561
LDKYLRYDRTARVLHWLIAILLLGQFFFGWWLGDIARNTPARGYFVNLHKSTGIVVGLLILVRLYWRLKHPPPPSLAVVAPWQQRLAVATHHLLYVCMVVMPLSGYLASNFSRHGVKLFNAITLPPWGPDDKALYAVFNQVHKATAVLLLALVVLHVLAVLLHGLRRDGVFSRIWLRPF